MLLEFIRQPKEPRTANYLQLCDYCKREFKSNRKDAKFCSPLCRVNANKAKKNESTTKTKKVSTIVPKEKERKSTAKWDNIYFDNFFVYLLFFTAILTKKAGNAHASR